MYVGEFSNSCFNNLMGFIEDEEFLPRDFDKFNSKQRLRQLFLNLSSIVFQSELKFSAYEQKTLSYYPLKEAFRYKVKSLLPISFIKSYKKNRVFKICIKSTIIINLYNKNKWNKNIFFSNHNLLSVAKYILYCFKDNKLQFLVDKHFLFHEFVFKKIKKLHYDKYVYDLGDAICIKTNDFHSIKIYTSWKDIKVKKPDIKNELENAIKSIKRGEYTKVFLVYPKNNEFTRHIPIFVDELKDKEYKIKAIPYSFRSIIKN